MIVLPTLEEIKSCQEFLKSNGITSETIKIERDIYAKNDGALPMNSYKIRGVSNFFRKNKSANRFEVLSAGNLALAVASECQKRRIGLKAIVPSGISEIKKSRLVSMGVDVCEIEFEKIWDLVLKDPLCFGPELIHPFHPELLCGYSTVLLDILDQTPDVKAVAIPYGLGGLTVSIAHAASLMMPALKIYPVEIYNFSPLARAKKNKKPSIGPKLQSFIEALGTPHVIPSIFEVISEKVEVPVQVDEAEVKSEIRRLYSDLGVRVEGAAGAALAAARKIQLDTSLGGPVVAHLTGANISTTIFNEPLS